MAASATAPIVPRSRRLPAASRRLNSPARFAPLFGDGEIRGLVEVEPNGMVDVAVRHLGARLVAVGVVVPLRN